MIAILKQSKHNPRIIRIDDINSEIDSIFEGYEVDQFDNFFIIHTSISDATSKQDISILGHSYANKIVILGGRWADNIRDVDITFYTNKSMLPGLWK